MYVNVYLFDVGEHLEFLTVYFFNVKVIELHPKTITCPTLHEIYAVCEDMYSFLAKSSTNLCVIVQSTVILFLKLCLILFIFKLQFFDCRKTLVLLH